MVESDPGQAADPEKQSVDPAKLAAAKVEQVEVEPPGPAASDSEQAQSDQQDSDSEQTEPAKTEAEKQAEAEETSRRTVARFLWSCAWLTVLVAVFLFSGVLQVGSDFGAVAWLGTVVVYLCMAALVAAYVGCALRRITLRTRLLGPVDVFQVSTVVVVVAVICGLAIPTDNKSAIALLFPWALTYWMYGLDRTKKPETPAS